MFCSIMVHLLCIHVCKGAVVSEFCITSYEKTGKTNDIAICLWFILMTCSTDQFHSTEGTTLVEIVSKKALTESIDLLGCTELLLFVRCFLSASFIYIFFQKPIRFSASLFVFINYKIIF